MNRTVTIVTPENIQITYQVAGCASRFMALLVDLVLQFLLILLVQMVMGLFGWLGGGFGIGNLFSAAAMILVYLVVFAYAIFFEMLWGGRTPGKRLFGLRVIRDGGYPITFLSSTLRNILRFVDFGVVPLTGSPLVLFGLPGLACIFFSPTYKRLGDYAAGTLVISERGSTPFGKRSVGDVTSPGVAFFLPLVKNLDRLTVEEYRLVRRFVARRRDLDARTQATIADRIARPLMQKLEISAPITFQVQYADLLEALEQRYAEEQGLL